MRPPRFPEERIIGMLKEQEAGAATAVASTASPRRPSTGSRRNLAGGTCPRPGACGRWRNETSKLKRTLADAMLDTVALKDLLERSGDARRRAEGRWCLTR